MKKYLYIAVLLLLVGSYSYYRVAHADIYGSSLIGWWNMDNNQISGASVTDLSGNLGTMTLTNSPTTGGAGISGQSVALTSVGLQYLTTPDNDRYSFGNGTTDSPFSVCVWMNMAVTTGFRPIGKANLAASTAEWALGTRASGEYVLITYSGGNSANSYFYQGRSAATEANRWVHFCATYNGTKATGGQLYLNGAPLTTTAIQNGTYVAMTNTTATLDMGVVFRGDANVDYSDGKIDDVRLYNRALTASEIAAIYYSGL